MDKHKILKEIIELNKKNFRGLEITKDFAIKGDENSWMIFSGTNEQYTKKECAEFKKYENKFVETPFKHRYYAYYKNKNNVLTHKGIVYIMFNPSFANLKSSDDTVRNAIKFANKEGYNKIIVLNLFPIRISEADFVCKSYTKEYLKNYKCEINLDDLPEKVVLCWGKLPQNIPYIDSIIEKLCSELNKNKTMYQITNENFQRHLSSPSVNSIGRIEQLKLVKIQSIYKFNK